MKVETYNSLDSMWWNALSQLLRCDTIGSRDGETREMLGFCGRYPARYDWVWNPSRNASAAYGAGELLWYLSGSDEGQIMEAYAPQYHRFLDDDGTAYGAYGRRISAYDQLSYCQALLCEQPDTRQAVISLWNPRDLNAAAGRRHKDIPCTIALQFLRRDHRLHLVTTMRSNDVWLGLPYDGWCFSQILRLMAASLGLRPGWIQHQVGSFHLYTRNESRARVAVGDGPDIASERKGVSLDEDLWATVRDAIRDETRLRQGDRVRVSLDYWENKGAVGEWVALIADKFGGPVQWLDERLARVRL